MQADAMLQLVRIFVLVFFLEAVQGKINRQKNVIEIDDDNWSQLMEGEWMIEFFAPWCPACNALAPIWDEFSKWSDDLGISVGQVDVTVSGGLSGRFLVTALPSIFHVKNGVFRLYKGSKSKDEFISFVEDQKWKNAETIPWYKDPGSFHMAGVAYFFRLSVVLRNLHNTLMEDYGFPMWGSFGVFALATVVTGAIIGLLLVCITDFLYPPKPFQYPEGSRGTHIPKRREAGEEDGAEGSQTQTEDDDDEGGSQTEEESLEDGQSEEEDSRNIDGSQSEDIGSDNETQTRKRRSRLAD